MIKKTPFGFLKVAMHRLTAHIAGTLGVGLIILMPFIVVSWVVRWITTSADDLLSPISNILPFVGETTGLGLVLLTIALYLAGLIAIHASGRKIIGLVQQLALKIPIIKSIYKPAKDLTGLIGESSLGKSRVVGIYLYNRLDLQTFTYGLYSSLVIEGGERFVHFCHLTSPTPPTFGAVFLVPEKSLYEILVTTEENREPRPMTIGELIQLIISGGISSPKNIMRRPLISIAPK